MGQQARNSKWKQQPFYKELSSYFFEAKPSVITFAGEEEELLLYGVYI